MTVFKSSYARLARIFKQSRNNWRAKAMERHRRIRALEVKVRDLEKSRAHWKSRALNKENIELPLSDNGSKDTPAHKIEEAGDDDERSAPHNHQYSLLMIRLSIELQLMYISLRGTC